MAEKRQEPRPGWRGLLLPPIETLMGAYEKYQVRMAMDVGLRGQAGLSEAHSATCFTFQPTWRGHRAICLGSLASLHTPKSFIFKMVTSISVTWTL